MDKAKSASKTQDIKLLKGADRVRLRPAVIFGSDGLGGCEHSVFEIISNSVDEAREGFGDVINITVFADSSIEVEDFGRGVPMGYNEKEGRYNWDLIFCEIYAGGKYDNNSDDGAYEYALGLNGLGACATQYTSEYMNVASYSDGKVSSMSFAKGNPVSELSVRDIAKKEKKSGTVIRWKPDLDVFTDINIPFDYYDDMLKKQAIVNAGLKFVLKWQKENGEYEVNEYLYENGIAEYVANMAAGTEMFPTVFWHGEGVGRDREDKPDYKLKFDIAFAFSNTVNVIEYFHNSSFLEHGGSPEKAVKNGFVYAIDKYLKTEGKYNKNESKITFADVEDSLIIVTNSFSTQTSYENQTKKAITNAFIADYMTSFIKSKLEIYFAENKTDAQAIATQVLVNKRSRESAESTRLNLKKKLQTSTDVTNKIEKFVDCRIKDPTIRELYIVEGDSALTSCKFARKAEFQALIPVRGKTLNCLKCSYDRIFESQIIIDLLKVMGCGVEIKSKHKSDKGAEFDINNLKFSKIIICTDADEDGFQIRTLILTIFYRLLPSLIKAGKVYIVESPLYQITTKDKEYFAYDEKDKAEILKTLGDTKCTIQRSKGLGENSAQMMEYTTMSPKTRRLIRVSEADAAKTAEIFDTLLGDNLEARKEFITNYGAMYIKDADI